jgi:sugar phosphate permease
VWFPKLYFWKREALLLVLQLLYVLNFFHRQLPGLLAPELMEAFSLSRAEIGLLAGTAFALFYAMTGIVVAVAGNNWSLRVVIAISVAIWSLAVILTSWATHSWQLFTLRFVFAAAQSAVTPQIYALLAKTEQRTKLGGSISRYASGIYIGLALSFALVGFAFSNWQAYFYWSGVYGIMLAFFFF